MRPWLVTGAGGFIGSRVCRSLAERGEAFVGWLRPGESPPPSPPASPWPDGTFRVVDVRDAVALSAGVADASPSAILNLAAVGVAPRDGSGLAEFVAVNVLVPGVLFEAMASDCALVQAGSMAQYAGGPGALLEDRSPRENATPYSWSKNAAEGLLEALGRRSPKPVVRVRLFGVTGPGEPLHRLLPSLVAGWRQRRPVPLSDGMQVRDVLHVDDVAAALLHVARAPALFGQAVNVGRGHGGSVRWMAEHAAQRLDCEELLRFGVLPRREGEPAELVADVSRLFATGWNPSRSLEQTVDPTVDALAGR